MRESRQMAEMQLSWEKQAAREKGLAEGLAEGRAEGAMEEKLSIACNMKREGMPAAMIAKTTGLTIEEIEKL